jgi:hypothetical protein
MPVLGERFPCPIDIFSDDHLGSLHPTARRKLTEVEGLCRAPASHLFHRPAPSA